MSVWSRKASKGGDGGNYEKAPPGNHPAVLVAIVDLGTQAQEYQGQTKEQHRAMFVWELVGVKKADGSNHVIGIDLTASLTEKSKLRHWIEARIGRKLADNEEYDILSELGKPCLLNVVEKNGYPKIEGVGAVPTGLTIGQSSKTPFHWELDSYFASGKIDVPDWLPWSYGKSVPDVIMDSKEVFERKQHPNKPAAPSVPSSAPKPPKPPSTEGIKYWLDCGNGTVEDFTADNAQDFLTTKGVNVDTALVCLDGTQEWKPAASFGLKTAF